jgi:thiol-disulfide isomerase/thioredoxin
MGKRIAVVAAIAAVVVLALWGYARWRGAGERAATPKEFTATTTAGQAFDLAGYRGKPTVINIFGSWCGPCNQEAPDLAAFARAHPEVDFVGVAVKDTPAAAAAFAQKYGLPYPIVLDTNGSISAMFKADVVPTTVFLNKDGVQKAWLRGSTDRAGFEADLRKAQ